MDARELESLVDAYDAQWSRLQSLLDYRVGHILLVASLYDSFTLSEGQHLAELISGTYYDHSLSSIPRITRVSTRRRALELLRERPFDLVITMAQVQDMSASEFALAARAGRPDLPIYLVAYNALELHAMEGGPTAIPGVTRAFVWRGDVRLFLTIIKMVEDERNAPHDTLAAGVRVLVVVEDSVSFYSSYLPLLLTELVKQTNSLIAEEVNLGQRMLRRRLRPKVLLATSFEEGWRLYERYRDNVLCVMTDARYRRADVDDPGAGLRLLRRIRATDARTPLLLQSSQGTLAAAARALGAGFLHKDSPTILQDLRAFMLDSLGFGDFVFRLPDGTEVARATDVTAMIGALGDVPVEALEFHGLRHDFSNWLMARTEFDMAAALRAMQVADFADIEAMRAFLFGALAGVEERRTSGHVVDFRADAYGPKSAFVRLGDGSLGGKGRGLAFMHDLISRGDMATVFEGVRVAVPRSAVIATDAFDRFIADNGLLGVALEADDDRQILSRFLSAPLPADVVDDLSVVLRELRAPIAVRSSSLLEDSQTLPAAGIYPTHMLANDGSDDERLRELCDAVRHVYAATYFRAARAYLDSTANLVEDEKMAVVIQEVVGRRHGDYVYPDLSGTADSYNYYPIRDMEPHDGVAKVALGLGKTVVAGERALRFSPARPQWLPQFSTPHDILEHAQRSFRALDLNKRLDFSEPKLDDVNVVLLPLEVAERHGTLWPVASTYSPENDVVVDGLSRPGVRVVTMAPVLKHRVFPLAELLQRLLRLGELGMSVPVELEFAVDLAPVDGGAKRFALLQVRPLGLRGGHDALRIGEVAPGAALIRAARVLGGGRIDDVRDVVVVRRQTFERAHSPEIARQVGYVNARLREAGRAYVLIGPGRWGTADPWLGVPVRWEQISGARVIVECPMGGLDVEPSQGTHFFHNVTSLGVLYFTVKESRGAIDWEWLEAHEPADSSEWVAHYRLPRPLDTLIDAATGEGVVLKEARPT